MDLEWPQDAILYTDQAWFDSLDGGWAYPGMVDWRIEKYNFNFKSLSLSIQCMAQ